MVLVPTKRILLILNGNHKSFNEPLRHGAKGSSIQVSTLEIDAIEMNRVIHWIAMKTYVLQCSSLIVREILSYEDGASRVRNGTPRSLPLGLLAPTVPWLQLYMNIHGFTCMG